MPRTRTGAALVLAAVLAATATPGCAQEPDGPTRAEIEAQVEARIAGVLDRSVDRIEARVDSIYEALLPMPLLRPTEEAALRRYLNSEQLAQARRLGVRPEDAAEVAALQREGRLVELEDSTEHWVVRELDASIGVVTPDVRALLTEIGERFQERLDELGLPPYRIEISSALRTAEHQAELRRTNPNAARGVSTHEFGTTVDVVYESYAAPAEPEAEIAPDAEPWLARHIDRIRVAMVERVAAQKSREIQAILADVLREMQAEGKVMVTLEERQPVFHMTVAERLAGAS